MEEGTENVAATMAWWAQGGERGSGVGGGGVGIAEDGSAGYGCG